MTTADRKYRGRTSDVLIVDEASNLSQEAWRKLSDALAAKGHDAPWVSVPITARQWDAIKAALAAKET